MDRSDVYVEILKVFLIGTGAAVVLASLVALLISLVCRTYNKSEMDRMTAQLIDTYVKDINIRDMELQNIGKTAQLIDTSVKDMENIRDMELQNSGKNEESK